MGGIATLGVLALIPSQVGSVFLGSLAGMKTGPVAAGLAGGLHVGLSDRLVVLVMTSPLITSLKVTDCLTYSSVVCPPTNSGLGLEAIMFSKVYKFEGALSRTRFS